MLIQVDQFFPLGEPVIVLRDPLAGLRAHLGAKGVVAQQLADPPGEVVNVIGVDDEPGFPIDDRLRRAAKTSAHNRRPGGLGLQVDGGEVIEIYRGRHTHIGGTEWQIARTGEMMSRRLVIGAALLLSACSDNGGTSDSDSKAIKDGNHVWKTMTDQIDRSRDVENELQDSYGQQRQAIEEQAR